MLSRPELFLPQSRPERAWRAFSQWRSSWLSREGVLAVLTYPPALGFTAAWLPDWVPMSWGANLALITAGLSVLTVVSTGMIYASLRPIPRWNNRWVVPVYLALAMASGNSWVRYFRQGSPELPDFLLIALILLTYCFS